MRIDIEESHLKGKSFNIAGSDRSWKDRIKALCRQHGWRAEDFVKAATRVFNASLGKCRLRTTENRTWSQFDDRRNPVVPESLRRLVAQLQALIRRKEPLPVAV